MNDMPYQDNDKTVIGVMEDDRTQVVAETQGNATQYAANVDCPVCHTPNPPSETYCIDCGFMLSAAPVAVAEMPTALAAKLVTTDGTREFPLSPGENSIGRENADVLLASNTVSRRHAKAVVEDGRVYVEDLGSTNGTFVDGRNIGSGERVELETGCEVMFGSVVLKFEAPEPVVEPEAEETIQTAAQEEPAEPGGEQPEAETPVEEPVLEEEPVGESEPLSVARFVSTDGALDFPVLAGTNTIGRRDGANSIVVSDPYCSGRHADLQVDNGVFTLTDIGSTNGTLVNGVKLEANSPRVIQDGDEITIGRIVFKIEVA